MFRSKILPFLGYASFFFTSCVVLSYFTFPYDRVRDFVIQEVENPRNAAGVRTQSGWRIDIEELGPHFLTGIALSGVRLRKVPSTNEERAADAPPPAVMTIPEATARVSILSLLTGSISVDIELEAGGGTIEATYAQSGDDTHIEAELDAVDLKQMGLSALIGFPIAGKLSGTLDLTFGAEPRATNGETKLAIQALVLGEPNAKLKIEGMGAEGITVGRITAGNFTLEAKAENGALRIEKLSSQGGDATIAGSGSIRLGRPLQSSTMDLLLRLGFTQAFRERDDRTRAIFSLVDLTPRLRQAKTPDGGLQWQVQGPMNNPRGTPAGSRPAPR